MQEGLDNLGHLLPDLENLCAHHIWAWTSMSHYKPATQQPKRERHTEHILKATQTRKQLGKRLNVHQRLPSLSGVILEDTSRKYVWSKVETSILLSGQDRVVHS